MRPSHVVVFFFLSSRRRHTRCSRDWSSDVCSSDLAASRKMRVHTHPQVKAVRIKGQTKCDVCLGVIKKDLPSVLCGCGKQYHNSCAVRVVNCPVCGQELGFSKQKPHVVDSDVPMV